MEPQTGSTHLMFRKLTTDIGVMEESRDSLESIGQGAGQLLLIYWGSLRSWGKDYYRLKLDWEVHGQLVFKFLAGPWSSGPCFDRSVMPPWFLGNWWWLSRLQLVWGSCECSNIMLCLGLDFSYPIYPRKVLAIKSLTCWRCKWLLSLVIRTW